VLTADHRRNLSLMSDAKPVKSVTIERGLRGCTQLGDARALDDEANRSRSDCLSKHRCHISH
jgi:hypothetical protein